MAELSTLARPYARAVFESAAADGSLQVWAESLELLASLSNETKIAALIQDPGLTAGQKAETLTQVCGDALSEKGANFVGLLAENHRLAQLPQIQEQFHLLKTEREKVVDVELVSAGDIDTAQQEKLTQVLAARLEREVNITVSVDSDLIGGVVVRAGDMIIDGSIRGRLNKLAEVLNS